MYLCVSRQHFRNIPEWYYRLVLLQPHDKLVLSTAENGNAIASPVAVPWLSSTRNVRQKGRIIKYYLSNWMTKLFQNWANDQTLSVRTCLQRGEPEISLKINAFKNGELVERMTSTRRARDQPKDQAILNGKLAKNLKTKNSETEDWRLKLKTQSESVKLKIENRSENSV